MQHIAVSSSNIQSVGYDPATLTMEIQFVSGSVYQYSGVTEAEHRALMSAQSKGKHFAEHIKGKFPFIPLPQKDRTPVVPSRR